MQEPYDCVVFVAVAQLSVLNASFALAIPSAPTTRASSAGGRPTVIRPRPQSWSHFTAEARCALFRDILHLKVLG